MIYFAEVIKDGHNKDESGQGRCKIRVYTRQDNEQQTKDQDLAFGLPLLEPTSASIAGVGKVPTGLLPGSRVAVMYANDDSHKQFPIILGTWPRGYAPVTSAQESDSEKDGKDAVNKQTAKLDAPSYTKKKKDLTAPANPRVNPNNKPIMSV